MKIIIHGGGPLAFYLGSKLRGQGHCALHQCKAERRNSFFKAREIIKLSNKADLSSTRDTYYPEAIDESINEEIIKCIHFYVMTPEAYSQHQKEAGLPKSHLNKRILVSSFLAASSLHYQMLSTELCCFLNIACDWSNQQLICIDNDSFISNQNFRSDNLNNDMPLMGASEELDELEVACTSNFIKTTLSYAYLIQRKHRANHIEALNGMKKLLHCFEDLKFSTTAYSLDHFFAYSVKQPNSLQGLLLSNLLRRSDHAMAYFLESLLKSRLIEGEPAAISEISRLLRQCKNQSE